MPVPTMCHTAQHPSDLKQSSALKSVVEVRDARSQTCRWARFESCAEQRPLLRAREPRQQGICDFSERIPA